MSVFRVWGIVYDVPIEQSYSLPVECILHIEGTANKYTDLIKYMKKEFGVAPLFYNFEQIQTLQ